MVNKKMVEKGHLGSAIRELFEYGNKRKKEIGEDNFKKYVLGVK